MSAGAHDTRAGRESSVPRLQLIVILLDAPPEPPGDLGLAKTLRELAATPLGNGVFVVPDHAAAVARLEALAAALTRAGFTTLLARGGPIA